MAQPVPPTTTAREIIIPGLICGYVFSEAGAHKATTTLVEASSGSFDWYHLDLTDARTQGWIARLPGMVPEAAKVFAAPLVHQTIAQHGDWIIGSLADLQIDFDKDVDNVGRLVFALSPERLITGRRHALECVERTRANINGYRRYASASALLESLVLEFGLRLEEAVPRLMNSLDLAEDRVLSEEVGDERMRLLLVRREVSQLHRHLRGFLKALEHAARQGASDRLSPFLRLRDRFQLIDQDIAAIEDRARLLQEEVAAKVSAGINRQLYILSLLTALFLPPSLVAGLFGMNVEHLPIAGRAGDFFFILMVAGASSLAVWLMIRHLRIRM